MANSHSLYSIIASKSQYDTPTTQSANNPISPANIHIFGKSLIFLNSVFGDLVRGDFIHY
jgi:hypothetical protein